FSRLFLQMLAALLTVYVCVLSSERYFMYWVQTTIERTDVHVSEIAFPAITICPTHLTLNNLNGTSIEEEQELNRRIKLFNYVQEILWNKVMNDQTKSRNIDPFMDLNNISLNDVMGIINAEFKCEDLFLQCKWRRRIVDCCSIFRPFGLGITCFTFNSLFAYGADSTWPWSVAGAGFLSGLNIMLNRNVAEHRVESLGVIVQEPDQYLGTSVTYSSDDRIVIPLQPLRFTAETAVKARPVNMRYCYFTDELENGESRSECIHKCHIKYITDMCKCHYQLPIQMKSLGQNANTTITRRCSIKDLPCFQKHKVSLFSMRNIIEESDDFVFNTTDCQCYPNCNHIQYHASIYTDRLSGQEHNHSFLELDVFFQDETLFSYRSTLHITMLDLIVSFGGIAGLFLGLSVVGAINGLIDRIGCCGKPTPH
ncbi:hypothetical protein KR222_001738, partial [Zaprionus bogoriensis]